MTDAYDDIIHLPHHVSKRHPQMSLQSRAAQFAPFACLSGHEEALEDTAQTVEDIYTIRNQSEEEIEVSRNRDL